MFCPNCGSEVSGKFCANCGSPVQPPKQATPPVQNTYQPPKQATPPAQNTYQPPKQSYTPPQQNYQRPQQSYQPPQPPQQNAGSTALPMSWHNFLTKFGLWLGALLNLGMAIMVFTGSHYGSEVEAEAVWRTFDSLKTYDMIYGVLLLALVAYQVFTRSRLAGFYADGPKHLGRLYLMAVLVQVLYIIMIYSAYTSRIDIGFFDFLSEMVSGGVWTNFIMSLLMVSLNKTYYDKRAALFTRT